jgi:hypothetical protein
VKNLRDSLLVTSRILESEHHDLRHLAFLAEYDPFSFYNHSDLRNLDLSNQSLLGLNFYSADFSNSKLENVEYERGAFNGAKLPEEYSYLCDEYDFTLTDIMDRVFDYFYLFVEFREISIETAIEISGMSYSKLARNSQISTATLRNARKGYTVAMDTATAISRALTLPNFSDRTDVKIENSDYHQPFLEGFDRVSTTRTNAHYRQRWVQPREFVSPHQPMTKLLNARPSGGFDQFTKKEFEYFKLKENEIVKDKDYSVVEVNGVERLVLNRFNHYKTSPWLIKIFIENGLSD